MSNKLSGDAAGIRTILGIAKILRASRVEWGRDTQKGWREGDPGADRNYRGEIKELTV